MRALGVVLTTVVWLVAGAQAATAAPWPVERQFPLLKPPPSDGLGGPPGAIAELRDGSLLMLVYWPVRKEVEGGTAYFSRTRVLRIAPDASRAFVPPFGDFKPRDAPNYVDDEILPLPDGSILFARYNAIDRRRPDGSIVRFAGRGTPNNESSGDGGPAKAADIGFAKGLARMPDGSVVFADRHQIRRVDRDGIITTIAGSAEGGFAGDGGPATTAKLASPSDVLPTAGGGFYIADTGNGRARRVDPDGVISTVAGSGEAEFEEGSGDGGPALAAGLAYPSNLARLADGSLLIGEGARVRKVSRDGTIGTILDARQVNGDRLGDFAGRFGEGIEAMEATKEGGVAVILGGLRLRPLYLAPPRTERTLVALRGTRASENRVRVMVDATAAGTLALSVRRDGDTVARVTRRVKAGPRVIEVKGEFTPVVHDVRVTLHPDGGGVASDAVHLLTSASLPKQLVRTEQGYPLERCKRMSSRRLDCEWHFEDDEEDGVTCLYTNAYRLFESGVVFTRPYAPRCHHDQLPLERHPDWTGPWTAFPRD